MVSKDIGVPTGNNDVQQSEEIKSTLFNVQPCQGIFDHHLVLSMFSSKSVKLRYEIKASLEPLIAEAYFK